MKGQNYAKLDGGCTYGYNSDPRNCRPNCARASIGGQPQPPLDNSIGDTTSVLIAKGYLPTCLYPMRHQRTYPPPACVFEAVVRWPLE